MGAADIWRHETVAFVLNLFEILTTYPVNQSSNVCTLANEEIYAVDYV